MTERSGLTEVRPAAPDGRLFRNERDGIIGSTTYSRVWEEARRLAFTAASSGP